MVLASPAEGSGWPTVGMILGVARVSGERFGGCRTPCAGGVAEHAGCRRGGCGRRVGRTQQGQTLGHGLRWSKDGGARVAGRSLGERASVN